MSEPSALMMTSQGPLDVVVAGLRAVGTDRTRIEAKAGLGESFWQTVSAFANTDGGVIVVGLSEERGFAPVGLDVVAVREAIVAGLRPPHPKVEPQPEADVDVAVVDGQAVVVVDVAPLPGLERPCFVTRLSVWDGSYERVGDGDRRLSRYAIHLLQTVRLQHDPTDGEVVEGASEGDLDPAAVAALLKRVRRSGSRIVHDDPADEVVLARLGVVTPEGVTLAGLLALGLYPQQFFPQCHLLAAVYPASGRGETADGVRLLDNQMVDGSIPHMIERGVDVIARNLRARTQAGGLGGQTEPELPAAVLREVLANALTHRDYGLAARGLSCQADVFPDRVEVVNPGLIWHGRDPLDLLAEPMSAPRNERLANLLRFAELPRSGEVVVEKMGTGLALVERELRRLGLPGPGIPPDRTRFRIRLPRAGAVAAALPPADVVVPAAAVTVAPTANLTPVGLVTVTSPSSPLRGVAAPTAPTRAMAEILAVLEEGGEALDVHQLAARTGKRPSALRPLLRRLVESGLAVATAPPTSRQRAYRSARSAR